MSDIYWISMLGNLSDAFNGFTIFSSIMCVVSAIMAVNNSTRIDSNERECYNLGLHGVKVSLIAFAVSILGLIFIPSEKQMYAIYGIGGTIDYIKSNDKAKQLPDKVVKALDAWVDKQAEEDKEGKQ